MEQVTFKRHGSMFCISNEVDDMSDAQKYFFDYEGCRFVAVQKDATLRFYRDDDQWVQMFFVPSTRTGLYTNKMLEQFIFVYYSGYTDGEKFGTDEAKREIREALGL